ncbi:MAG: hypothetical protein M3P95_12465, partial [Actinomycetota bacterium]|nr:hypothetical protein [Actinomycetota bacterium]
VELPGAPEPELDPRLYRDSLDSYLDVLREVDDAVEVLVVVAHNPWVARLVHELADRGFAAPVPPPTDVPPGSVAVLELPGPWSGTGPGAGTLVAFAAPPYDGRG